MTDAILYGIPNCDTIRKARAWLDARGIAHLFHDYRKAERPGIDRDRAIALMQAQPAMIRRPLLEQDGTFLAGFRPADYERIFGA